MCWELLLEEIYIKALKEDLDWTEDINTLQDKWSWGEAKTSDFQQEKLLACVIKVLFVQYFPSKQDCW